MNWLYPFGTTEIFFAVAFTILYLIYFGRVFWLARQLRTSARAVIPKFFLRTGYFVLLLIALLGPSFGVADQTISAQSRDLFVVADLSRSMDASDVVPTRLERLKFDIRQLTDSLAGDRIGLIVATDEPFVLTPLTADQEAIRQSVQALRTDYNATGGTNLCRAIELAQQKLLSDSSARLAAKGIIIYTDGEDATDCDRAVLARLRTYRMPVMAVGVGTPKGGTIRDRTDFVRDKQGQIVRSRLNRTYLNRLATQTNGFYFELTTDGTYLPDLTRTVREIRGVGLSQQQVAVATNKYYYFVWIALLLIALDLVVTVRTFRL